MHILPSYPQLTAARPHRWLDLNKGSGMGSVPSGNKPLPGPMLDMGSGNGLVPSGNKPLPGTMLAQIFAIVLHRKATVSENIEVEIFLISEYGRIGTEAGIFLENKINTRQLPADEIRGHVIDSV